MNPNNFLDIVKASWPRVSESDLVGCSAEEIDEIRMLEEQMAIGEFAALSDIILNCHNRFQFAKTYKTLWADLRKTLSQPGSPSVPDHKKKAIKLVFDTAIRYKLDIMARWFDLQLSDKSDQRQVRTGKFKNAIDIYAGKEGIKASGCAGSVLILFFGGLSFTASLAVLL